MEVAEEGASRSKAYYTDHFYLFRNKFSEKSLEEGTIAIKQHLPAAIRAEFQLPNEKNVVKAANIAEALKMVDNGEVDFTFALQNVADYYMSYEQLKNVAEVNVDVCTVYCCSVFSEDFDRIAMDICNKCITHIDESVLDRYITDCIIQDVKKHTFVDYLREHWYYFAAGAALILLVVIALLTAGIINISGKNKKIQKMLYGDEVTGGSSYLKFVTDVNKLFEENNEPCYIMYADISNFKFIDDTYGYTVGDKVLAEVEKFGAQLVEGYPVARMYADHFAGVCAYQEREALEEKLQRAFAEFDKQIRVKFKDFNVFLKVGIYYWDRTEKQQIVQMVNYASYAADNLKNLFRSEYCFYSTYMHDRVLKTQQIEKDMHRAMNAGEFIAYYQPKVDAYTNEIVGAEALVRWKHRDRGLVSPGEFVPVFERNHFIREVDFCIYERTCAMLASRMAKGQKIVPISCNFSRLHFYQQDFYQRDFVERLIQILDKYKVPAQYIELEITETVAAEDFGRLIETVQRLKTIGFLISIDDFGSGYSSIQLLYKIPIDVLKLDRVFVCEKCKNKREEEVYRNLIKICKDNHIKIICEGVETNEQKEFVMSYGCRYIQGFLYSRPLPDNEFQAMLDNERMM